MNCTLRKIKSGKNSCQPASRWRAVAINRPQIASVTVQMATLLPTEKLLIVRQRRIVSDRLNAGGRDWVPTATSFLPLVIIASAVIRPLARY